MFEIRKTAAFAKWLADLRDLKAVATINIRLRRVSLGNLGDFKAVGDGVCELRIDFGPGHRLYFVRRGLEVIVLQCGGDKKSQDGDIVRAKAMAKELSDAP